MRLLVGMILVDQNNQPCAVTYIDNDAVDLMYGENASIRDIPINKVLDTYSFMMDCGNVPDAVKKLMDIKKRM